MCGAHSLIELASRELRQSLTKYWRVAPVRRPNGVPFGVWSVSRKRPLRRWSSFHPADRLPTTIPVELNLTLWRLIPNTAPHVPATTITGLTVMISESSPNIASMPAV